MFQVIQGGLSLRERDAEVRKRQPATREAVMEEARRRIAASGHGWWLVREHATGGSMPVRIKNLKMQIDYVAQAMCKRAVIPDDFASDEYWPS